MESIPFLVLKNIHVKNYADILFEDLNICINQGEQWAITSETGTEASNFLQIFNNKFILLKGSIDFCFYKDFIYHHQPKDPLFSTQNLIALVALKHHFKNLSSTNDFYYQQRYNAQDAEDAPSVQNFLSGITASTKDPFWTFEKVTEVLGLKKLLDVHIIKLSNGEMKKLLLGAALLKNPLLLLLDHPFAGLDVDMRIALKGIIKEIAQSGITILLATNPHEIPDAITHVAVLENTRIKSVKPLKEFHSDMNSRNFDMALPTPELPNPTSSIPLYDFKIIAGLYNIKIRYGNKLILDDVTWQIKQGERWALLGPNGAGKTTLLSLINGDNPQAYANNIVLFDKKRGSGESIWEIKEKIGFMSPELYQYFPSNFTCIKTVESGFYDSIGLYRKSDPYKASVSLQWMQSIGIQQYSKELFRMVPASIQRLCLLLRALVKYPPLLLLDEPCQGLDSHQKEYIKLLINKICENNNTTLVYVTHYREEIPSCVKKVLNLKEGKIVF